MSFTETWSEAALAEAENYLRVEMPDARMVLEIGAYEGRSVVEWAKRWPAAYIHVIESFCGGSEHTKEEAHWAAVKERYVANTLPYRGRVQTYVSRSRVMIDPVCRGMLPNPSALSQEHGVLDFVFIDGSHEARDVCLDALLAAPYVKVGGLILFDDYGWRGMPGAIHQPALGIDAWESMTMQLGWKCLHKGWSALYKRVE